MPCMGSITLYPSCGDGRGKTSLPGEISYPSGLVTKGVDVEDGPTPCMGEGIRETGQGIEVTQDKPVVHPPEQVPAVPAPCIDPVLHPVCPDVPDEVAMGNGGDFHCVNMESRSRKGDGEVPNPCEKIRDPFGPPRTGGELRDPPAFGEVSHGIHDPGRVEEKTAPGFRVTDLPGGSMKGLHHGASLDPPNRPDPEDAPRFFPPDDLPELLLRRAFPVDEDEIAQPLVPPPPVGFPLGNDQVMGFPLPHRDVRHSILDDRSPGRVDPGLPGDGR